MKNRSTQKTPFEIVYLSPPHFTLDLVNLPQTPGLLDEAEFMAEYVTKIHTEVTQNLQKANDAYKQNADSKRWKQKFEVGDLVMVFLWKERFPAGTYNKLKQKKIGPCKILSKINSNAYKVELLVDLHISPTFNVSDLNFYKPPDEFRLAYH